MSTVCNFTDTLDIRKSIFDTTRNSELQASVTRR